jgi:hypothetical protein
MVALWLAVVTWAALSGPGWYAKHMQQLAAVAEVQNQEICARLNMPSGGDDYAECASGLNEARHQQDAQNQRQAANFF